MNKLINIILITALGYTACAHANFTETVRTFPSLPHLYKENLFKDIQAGYEERANLFLKGKNFHAYQADRSDKEIKEEFKNLNEWRNHTWYSDASGEVLVSRPDFMVAQSLLQNGLYRRPFLIAFDYNHSDDFYNSSTIVLSGHRFLALEAPSNRTLENFFKLLQNYQVNKIVRLTPAIENGVEKSFPYWANKVKKDPKTQQTFFNLPLEGSKRSMPIRYYAIENWVDNQGIEPKVLLKTIEKFQEEYDPSNDMVAVHCSGGVGRTGTFIAGFLILREIDRQLASGTPIEKLDISIEKIVMQLSLQRALLVATPSQYVTLHRLVDLYLEKLKKEAAKSSDTTKNPV